MIDHIKNGLSFAATLIIPLLYLLNLILIADYPATFSLPVLLRLMGVVLAGIGVVLWVVSMFQLRRSFGVLPQKQKRIRTGMYRYLRHPMYVGILMTFFGLSASVASRPGLLFTLFLMVPLLVGRAILEERQLV
jgi:protein-S-isoprenylcysteine O-methyltransferase Ste14